MKHVMIIGHIDHGKTSLTAAITKVLAENPGIVDPGVVDPGIYPAEAFKTNVYDNDPAPTIGNRKQRRAMRSKR